MQRNKEEATDKRCGSLLAEVETKDEERPLEILAAFSMRLMKRNDGIKEATSIGTKRNRREHPYCSRCGVREQEELLPTDGSDVPQPAALQEGPLTAETPRKEPRRPDGNMAISNIEKSSREEQLDCILIC